MKVGAPARTPTEFAAAQATHSTLTVPLATYEPDGLQVARNLARQVAVLDPWEKAQRLLDSEDYPTLEQVEGVLLWAGRNHGPAIVWSLYVEGCLRPQDAQRVVPDVWQMAEFPLEALDRDEWAVLFAFCGGYLHNGVRRARPRKARTLYRGADAAHRDGWSWSDNRAQAQWFADRFPGGRLWTATVEPARLLARITEGRGESEYVVNTDGLRIAAAGGGA